MGSQNAPIFGGLTAPRTFLEDFPPQFWKYNTMYPGKKEIVGWTLYDTVTYTTAVTLAATLFTVARATIDLSNMEVPGQIPNPKAFLIRAIRFLVKQRPESIATAAATNPQTGALDNIAQLANTGTLELTIGNKEYGQFPLWALPAGAGPYGTAAVENILVGGAVIDYGVNGYPHAKNLYTLTKPLLIPPMINFRVDLSWPAAITLTRTTTITVILDGDMIRPIQ